MSFTLPISGFCLIDKSSIIHLFQILKEYFQCGPSWSQVMDLGLFSAADQSIFTSYQSPLLHKGVEEPDSHKAKRNIVTSPAQWEPGRAGDGVRYLGSDVTFPHFSIQKRRRPLDPRRAAKPS